MSWINIERLFSAMLASAGSTVIPSSSINILKAGGLVPVTCRETAFEAPVRALTAAMGWTSVTSILAGSASWATAYPMAVSASGHAL